MLCFFKCFLVVSISLPIFAYQTKTLETESHRSQNLKRKKLQVYAERLTLHVKQYVVTVFPPYMLQL